MPFADFHVHTLFSDGKSTVFECVHRAKEQGLAALGISDHSYTPFDKSYCMTPEKGMADYEKTLLAAKRYAKEELDFTLLAGVELDFGSKNDNEHLDYTIGSVHYILLGDDVFPVDSGLRAQQAGIDRFFGGNHLDFAKTYFEHVVTHAEQNHPTFMGHLDLLSKYQSFDEEDEEYRRVVHEAIAETVRHVPLFEVSAGPMIRGLKSIPYPNPIFLEEIKRCGGKVILSSDAHHCDKIAAHFDTLLSLVRAAGFTHVSRLTESGIVEDEIASLSR